MRKKEEIRLRVLEVARYFIDNNATVRQTAKAFGISKSTVHLDITERLVDISPILYDSAYAILQKNRKERYIRGGLATKEKYLKLKSF